jgi:DNA modification methylase
MRLDDLFPADYNPRKALKAGDAEYEKLKRSITEFGLVEPLIWNERFRRLVGGHQRLTVLRDMGATEADVSVVDLDEGREKALNVALNKISGDWDEKALAELMKSLDGDLQALSGFDDVELDDLLGEKAAKKGDALPEAGETVVSQRGDVWILGVHRVMCGDSTSAADMAVLMDGQAASLIVTDPPYNVAYEAKVDSQNTQSVRRAVSRIENDSMEDAAFRAFLHDAFVCMCGAAKPGAPCYVFHADTEGVNFRETFEAAGFYLSQVLVWVKSSLVMGRSDYHWRHEPILYGWRADGSHKWYGARKKTTVLPDGGCVSVQHREDGDVITFSDGLHAISIKAKEYEVLDDGTGALDSAIYFEKPAANDLHPTMKPVGLLAKLIKNSSRRGDLVLDPFGGSGSTLIASEAEGRKACAMELDPFYCDQIVKRYVEFTARSDVFLLRDGRKIPFAEAGLS